jgi:GTP cyclohydrolase I
VEKTHYFGDDCVPPHEHVPGVPLVDVPRQQLTPNGPVHGGFQVQVTNEHAPHTNWDELAPHVSVENLAAELLRRFGVDTSVGHMEKTPARYVKMMEELTTPEPFEFTIFEAKSDEMVVLSPIPFYTLCAHHVVPFYGTAHVGYVPGKAIAGLSKFGRLVRSMARGLWVQEELTAAIADAIEHELHPKGVALILRGEHMCMSMRGVQMPGVVTSTQTMRGVFADHSRTAKMEFLEAIRGK